MQKQAKEDIPIGVNLFNKNGYGYTEHRYINKDGILVVNSPSAVSNYIPVKSDYTFFVKANKEQWYKIVFYDENYGFISAVKAKQFVEESFEIGPDKQYPIPENARFARINVKVEGDFLFERTS